MSERKYRHRGYMDNDREAPRSQEQRPKQQSKPVDREGPRSPKMMAFGETVKCSSCAAKAPPSITLESTCPNCRADLHTCRQCTYFDPSAHFQCSKSIPARIVNKNARNTCELHASSTKTRATPASCSSHELWSSGKPHPALRRMRARRSQTCSRSEPRKGAKSTKLKAKHISHGSHESTDKK